jgi:hypothetical protein
MTSHSHNTGEASNAPENERPEPFATLLELISEHGLEIILEDLSSHCEFESEDNDNCSKCRQRYAIASSILRDAVHSLDPAILEHEAIYKNGRN